MASTSGGVGTITSGGSPAPEDGVVDIDPWVLIGALVAGLVAGVLAGMFGVGGAVVTTPAIRALGVAPILAVGSTIPAILPAALSGSYQFHRKGLVDRRVAFTCGGAGAVAAIAGSWTSDQVDARWLMVMTAPLLAWTGINSIRLGRAVDDVSEAVEPPAGVERADGDEPATGAAGTEVATAALVAVGVAAGFVAGLLGVGGGIVMMPLFTSVLRLPVKVAVASSLVAVALFSVPALVTHTVLGHVDWPVASALVVGAMPGATVGSRFAIAASDARLRVAIGWFFCFAAFSYGGAELVGIIAAG